MNTKGEGLDFMHTEINQKYMTNKTKLSKIEMVAVIILIGFTLSVLFHYIIGNYFHYGFPWNNFLFRPDNALDDFKNAYMYAEGFNPYSVITAQRNYPPFGFLIIGLFTFIEKNISFFIFETSFILFLLAYLYKSTLGLEKFTRMKNTFIIFFMSFPILFTLDRANFEIVVFMFLFLFIYFYERNKINTSVVFLAMAIAMKLFPLVFLVIFLSDKRYKEVLITGGLVILLTLLSLLIFQGDVATNISHFAHSLNLYNRDYVIGSGGFGYGHSLFGVLKLFFMAVIDAGTSSFDTLELIKISMRPYFIFVIILFLLISTYIIKYETELWKKMLLLVISVNLFPYVSADYKLIHFFIPLMLFFISRSDNDSYIKYSILFGLLLMPKSFYWIMSEQGYVSASIILNPLIMCMFIVFLMKDKYGVLNNKIRKV